ncbi:MAG: hypothetical protein IPO13_07135 [Rhodocyclaceae bacterium]|nr:hypothetical protein [Rhodocyclaceae bacterium]
MTKVLIASCMALLTLSGCGNTQKESIELPKNISGVIVGTSTYAEVTQILGKPEFNEDASAGSMMGLKYPSKGIEVYVSRDRQMTAETIEIYKPFAAKSSEGLFVGMPVAEATNILNQKYGQPKLSMPGMTIWRAGASDVAFRDRDGIVVAFQLMTVAGK